MLNILINSALITLLCMMPKSTMLLCNRQSDVYSVPKESHTERFIKSVSYPEYFQRTHFANKIIEPIETVAHSRSRRDAEHKRNQTSLVFVFDASRSMSSNLVQIRQGAEQIINKLSQRIDNLIYNYIFVPFTEIFGKRVTGPALVTTDKQELFDALDKLKIHGGGDCPEIMISGLQLALQHALPKSYVYTFSDATAEDLELERNVTELIQRKQATLSFLMTGYCDGKENQNQKYKVIERLATMSNGQIFDLITEDIVHILNDVGDKLHAHNVLLNFFNLSAERTDPIEFLVDKTVSKFDMIVSGQEAKVTIFDPNNNILDKPMTTIDLKNVAAYTVADPMIGKWKMYVMADDVFSVRITGTSNVSITYGYSVQSPDSMAETTFNPLIGAPNIVSIMSTHKLNLTHVQFRMDEENSEPIFLTLTIRNSSKSREYIYETVAFDPPQEPLKILVNGFDEANNPLQRLLSTTVQMLDKVPPIISMEMKQLKIIEGDPLFIKCKVLSAIPFEFVLRRDNYELKRLQLEQSEDFDYAINSTKLDNSGVYTCGASNEHGSISRSIHVNVINFPKSITIPKSEYIVEEKQSNFTIPCLLLPEPHYPFNVSWFFNGVANDTNDDIFKTDGINLIIHNLTTKNSGNYTCRVSVKDESSSVSTQLTVLFAPRLQQAENETIFIPYGESVAVNCSAVALPQAQLKWKLPSDVDFKVFEMPLQIESFTFSDEGLYMCELSNGITPAAMRRVTLRGVARDAPNITKTDIRYLNVTEGDSVNLMCHCEMCEPLLDYMWLHENAIGKNQTNLSTTDYNSDEFANRIDYSWKIESVSVNDSGKYICYMKNDFGSDTHSLELNVKIPPKIDGIRNDASYHMCSIDQQVNLVLFDASDSIVTYPSRVYNCSASDMHSIDTTIVLLEASPDKIFQSLAIHSNESNTIPNCMLSSLRSPGLTQLTSDRMPEVMSSRTVTPIGDVFECVQQQNETSPINIKPLLVIFVAPTSLTENDAKLIHVDSRARAVLKCSSTNLMAIQPYTCEMFNNFAAKKDSFYFLFEDPPKIQPNFANSIRLKRGESISIACYAVGSPNVQVYWTADESMVAINELRIESANEKFKVKNFTCVAENPFGNDYRSIFVTILDKPELTMGADDIAEIKDIHLGSDFELSCPFKNFNRFKWLKNGEPFNDASPNIVLKNISRFDAGNYTCHVSNEAGECEYTYEITVQYPPIFENSISNATTIDVNSSRNFSIECQVDGFPTPEIRWFHDGKIVSENKTLSVENVDASKHGDYKCNASNKHGVSQFIFTLNVLFAPVAMIDTDQTVNVIQNNSIFLNCSMKANPKPTFEWFKDDIKIAGANDDFIEIQGYSLTDAGVYKCLALNMLSNNSMRFNVNIFAGASIQFISRNVTSMAKDAIILTCNAYGSPHATLSWIHDNRVLLSSSKSIQMNASLTIEPFKLVSDADLTDRLIQNGDNINGAICYKQNNTVELELRLNEWPMGMHRFDCIAFNAHGIDERSTFVERFIEPIASNQSNTMIEVLNGTPITLNCSVKGYPMPEIAWQKDDIDIDFALPQSQQYSLENGNTSLRILHVSQGDGASYSCVAKNALGANTIDFRLNILTPPKLTEETFKNANNSDEFGTQLTVRYNESLSLVCPVDGNPTWTTSEQFNESIRNVTLDIEHVVNSTVFVCHANNSWGQFNYSFRVLVERPPEFRMLNDKEHRYRIGDSFTLNCDVFAQPTPNITWYKDNALLDGNSSTGDNRRNIEVASRTVLSNDKTYLRITNATVEQFGEYVCVAENHLGSIKRTFDTFFNPYWTKWSHWSECSRTCGKGVKKRHRECHQMQSSSHAKNCTGKNEEIRQCTNGPCRLNWSQCSKTCGYGQTYRVIGSKVEIASCFRTACPGRNLDIRKYTPAITWESRLSPGRLKKRFDTIFGI